MLVLKDNGMQRVLGYDPEPVEKLRKLQRALVVIDLQKTRKQGRKEAKSRTETHTPTAKASKIQRKHIHCPPLHLEKMSQESQINKACDKEDTSSYSGLSFVQKDEEYAHQARHIRERKNLQLSKDESKQKSGEFSVKFKTTDCLKVESLLDNSKEGASLRQMPSNLTSKMLDWEGKGAFGKTISAALQTFPKREETTLKIVSPSHEDPGSPEDSPWDSSSELSLSDKELHSENDHKPNAEQVLNKNEQSFYNDTENEKVRTLVVTSGVKEDQEFPMQMTKNMNPNTTDWNLVIGPTPQSHDPKSHPELELPCCNETKIIIEMKRSHLELELPCCNETKIIIEMKSHDMPAVINIYKETKPNEGLFQNPLCADNFSANYCTSMDSRLKDVSSSALHNDRTSGVSVIEKLKQDMQSLKNDIEMLKVEKLSWEKEKVQLQKETRRASQEISEPLTSTHNTSNICHLELRTPLLQASQDDSRKRNRKPLVTPPRSIGTQKMFGKETNLGSEADSRGQH